MLQNRPSSRRASVRPSLHALEQRALLNAAMPTVKHLAVHAEISAARRESAPIVPNVESSRVARAHIKVLKKHAHADFQFVKDRFTETNLVSDIQGMAPNTDPNLQGAWGLSFSSTSPFWVSAQAASFKGSGASSVYKVADTPIPTSTGSLLTVGVTNQGNAPPSGNQTNGPTGQVATGAPGITTTSTDFPVGGSKAAFIFANLDGSISGWAGGPASTIEATVPGASFTGLAIGNTSTGAAQIYAADQNSGKIDVFNSQWQLTGSFLGPAFCAIS